MSSSTAKKSFDFAGFARVLRYVRPYRRLFVLSLLLALLMGALSPVRGVLIQYTVDKGLKGQPGSVPGWLNQWFDGISHGDMARFVVLVSVLQVVVLLVETLVRFAFAYGTARLGQYVVKDMRTAVFKKILGLNLRQFDSTPIGTLTTRTVNDIESINEIFADGLIPIIADFLTIVITLATMFYMDWQLTLISLIPFPILLVATWIFKESVNKSFTRVRNAVSQLNAFVQEHLTGMQMVQAFNAETREFGRFRQINRDHRNANINAIFAYSVFFPVVEVVLAISLGLLVWWVAGQRLEAGKLIAFILFLNQIFRPLRVIADKFNVIQMGMVASERVFKVLDNPDEMPAPAPDAWQPATVRGDISFRQVSFGYQPPAMVLQQVSFEVAAGHTLAIVGSTGSGKTTIISLLNRLYEVQEGSIAIDGVDIRQWHPEALRSRIGVVLQDVFLFSGSVLDNITLRNADIPQERVEEVCRLIGIHDFIMQLPGQYHFNVMERGATLSAGQRQLLSFARCLLYNPAILILDEATSNIDSESEALIQQAIDKMIAGRTAIVIAHRLSTIRKAHQILVLDRGEVKEMGSHEQLLAAGGHYARLHELQFDRKKAPRQQVVE
ncbi:MAG: ABC transporter ATP-binding protein/permease [Chitinophagaceae bacterium]|jgi:ATP-binding cassette subfamily B protein|nr:ABC transporter ATP-binding protein/permease [Chitinophagaceae bacterium]